MKKLGCAKCGGMKKMAKGGTTKNVNISKPGAGYAKETKGDTNQKMGIYGIAQTGPTGPNNSGIATMKKGGSTFGMLSVKAGVDKNPKATAADRIAGAKMNKMKSGGSIKKPLMKAQKGIVTDSTSYKPKPVYMSKKAVKEREAEMAKQKAEDYYTKNPGTRPTSYTDTTSKPKSKSLFKKVGGAVKSKKK